MKEKNSVTTTSNNTPNSIKEVMTNEDLYFKIDSKDYFHPMKKDDIELLNENIKNFGETAECSNKRKLTNKILFIYLSKIYPDCEAKALRISNFISRDIGGKVKLSKENIEKYINYFYSLRYEIKYSTTLKLNRECFRNLGYIFCYIFKKFHEYNIKDSEFLKGLITSVFDIKIDVITDFYNYCAKNGLDPSDSNVKKTTVWSKMKTKYDIPPEMIFLINIFQRIDTLDINIFFEGEDLEDNDIKLFTITLLNINYILVKLKTLKINLTHEKLQHFLYLRYHQKLINILNNNKEWLKKNKNENSNLIYDSKWDFQHDFNLEIFRINKQNKPLQKKSNKNDHDIFSSIYSTKPQKENLSTSRKSPNNNESKSPKTSSNITDEFFLFEEEDIYNSIISTNTTFSNTLRLRNYTLHQKSNKLLDINNELNYQDKLIDITEKKYQQFNMSYSYIFDAMIITLCSISRLTSIKRIDLDSNYFYTDEVISYLKKKFKLNVLEIDSEFHPLNIIFNNSKYLETLNIEINSLDNIVFQKILGIIFRNSTLKCLKLSLFTSEVSYFPQSLLKLYEPIMTNKDKKYLEDKESQLNIDILEEKILNELLTFFTENLNLLFQIIKLKKNLETIGFNFELPSILKDKMNYNNSILKFILNILFFISNIKVNNNRIKKLILLCPELIIDNRTSNKIDNCFNHIKIHKNNKNLEEVNIQFEFYRIKGITHLICPNLIILSLGNLDLYTFKCVVNYITEYKFCSISCLKEISLSLVKKLIEFSTDLKLLLAKLFNIKISTLLEMRLFTNILLYDKKDYMFFIKIIKHNWIPSYVITFNLNSVNVLKYFTYINDNISFIVSHFLEKKLIDGDELVQMNYKENPDIKDEVYWYLKYIFTHRYYSNVHNFALIKEVIYSILKYLYYTKNVKVKNKMGK